MPVLSVNLNKVAWLRNARGGGLPDIVDMAQIVLDSGAQGITVHPRPDQRHIHPEDVYRLADLVTQRHAIEYNIEGNPFAGPRNNGYPGLIQLIEATNPAQATLVPDNDAQLTSDHGFDLLGDNAELTEMIAACQSHGARVSLFMDPDPKQIDQAKAIGADRIELYTGPYADTFASLGPAGHATQTSLRLYAQAAQHAFTIGLGVNAGHDLDLHNLPAFCGAIPSLAEVSIGHALISDALVRGLASTVRAYVAACDGPSN